MNNNKINYEHKFDFWLRSEHQPDRFQKKKVRKFNPRGVKDIKRKNPLFYVISMYIIFSFLSMFILKLPFLLNQGQSIGFLDSFFVGASALTTTGLSTVNVLDIYNYLGWIIIIIIFNIGGVGIIVTNTTIMLLLGRKIGINNRILAKYDSNKMDIHDIMHMTKRILFIFWTVEIIGAILIFMISLRFYDYNVVSCFMNSLFLSASATSGSGFYNVTMIQQNYLLQIVIIFLMIFSFIGYPIILDLIEKIKFKMKKQKYQVSLFTKISLKTNIVTLVLFAVLFLISEHANALADYNIFQQIQYAIFMSVSTKSVGLTLFSNFNDFNTITLFLFTAFMIIGGSPSSACGGVKVISVYVIYKHIVSIIFTGGKVYTSNIKIKAETIMRSYALVFAFVLLSLFSTIVIALMNPMINIFSIWFDVVSGYTTTGFSVGALESFNDLSIIIIALLMLIGRIGILNILDAFNSKRKESMRVERIEKDIAL